MARTSSVQLSDIKVSTSSVRALSQYLIAKNFSSDSIQNTIGFELQELEQSDLKIPIESLIALWDAAIEFTQDPALGLYLGQNSLPDDMGLVGHIFFNNATLGKALTQYQRYYSLVNEGMHIDLDVDDNLASMVYVCDVPEAYCIPDMDRTMSISITRAATFLDANLDIEYIGFQHKQPGYLDRYEQCFPCPIKFDQPHCSIVFKRAYLDFRMPKRSAYLHRVLTHHIESLLSKVRPKSLLSDKVKKVISERLAKASIDADHVAEKLCMSRHTMYRRLKQEGFSFHELVDQVREDKALRYLQQEKYALNEIAFLLGFSELSAFSRAFKRWTGKTPAQYKKDIKD